MTMLRSLTCILATLISVDLYASVVVTLAESSDKVTLSTESGNFGASPEVAIHDDFDSGNAGEPLQNWSISANLESQKPSYSNLTSITGKQSGMSSFVGESYNSSAEFKNLPSLDTVYLSYYFKVDQLNGEPSRNIKLARLSGGHEGGTYVQSVGFTLYDVYANGQFLQASIDFSESKVKPTWFGDYSDSKWHRAEYYIKLSNPAKTANGITIAKLDGKTITEQVNIVNEETGMRYKWLTLPYYVAHSPGGDYKIYYDNVVVSKNRARIELCDNDNYSDCKNPIIVKAASWSPKSITIAKDNLSIKKPYIFVFDENGNIVGKAIYYCPDCPSSPTRKG